MRAKNASRNIDQNIDFDLIKKIDSLNTYVIILMGYLDNPLVIKEYSLRNTYIIPSKDYSELKNYITYFDLVFFPLKADIDEDLYEKTLQCSAMKTKVITYEYKELSDITLPNVMFVKNKDELVNNLDKFIEDKNYDLPKEIEEALQKYSWESVINKVLVL